MKKIAIGIVSLIVFISLSACNTTQMPTNKTVVKTQLWAIDYITKNVGKEYVETSLAVTSGDAHHKEPTQKEIAELSKSKAFFYVGAGDVGVEAKELIAVIPTNVSSVDVTAGMSLVQRGDETDPHVWLSPKKMIEMTNTVASELGKLDPSHATIFTKNADELNAKFTKLSEQITTLFANKTQRAVLVEHPAYAYFASEFQINQFSMSGVHNHKDGDTDGESEDVSAAQIGHLKEDVGTYKLQYLFKDNHSESELTAKIATEIGVQLETITTLEVVNGSDLNKTYEEQLLEIATKFAKEME